MDSTDADSIGSATSSRHRVLSVQVAVAAIVDWDEYVDRRTLLTLAAGGLMAACAGPPGGTSSDETPRGEGAHDEEAHVRRIEYGTDAQQFAELTRPDGPSKGVVVVIHGGFWQAQYDLSLGRPLAVALAASGWTAYNIEYRRVGNGGGWPTTFDDVSAAIDALAGVDDLDTSRVITLGHSAGGHLAVLAASRRDPVVAVTAAVSQAGVLDLAAASRDDLGGGAVARLLAPESVVRAADPTALVPVSVPVRCIHGRSDDVVPLSQSTDYVDRATASGGDAELVVVDGDHFTVIDTGSTAWTATLRLLDEL